MDRISEWARRVWGSGVGLNWSRRPPPRRAHRRPGATKVAALHGDVRARAQPRHRRQPRVLPGRRRCIDPAAPAEEPGHAGPVRSPRAAFHVDGRGVPDRQFRRAAQHHGVGGSHAVPHHGRLDRSRRRARQGCVRLDELVRGAGRACGAGTAARRCGPTLGRKSGDRGQRSLLAAATGRAAGRGWTGAATERPVWRDRRSGGSGFSRRADRRAVDVDGASADQRVRARQPRGNGLVDRQ